MAKHLGARIVILLLSITACAFAQNCPDGSPAVRACVNGACLGANETCYLNMNCCTAAQMSMTTTPSTCVDKTNPSTGRSDCPNVAYLCSNAAYYQLMTEQCPATCGRCGGGSSTIPPCIDKINPSTDRSDCPGVANLCNSTTYFQLMTEQCPATCGRCRGGR